MARNGKTPQTQTAQQEQAGLSHSPEQLALLNDVKKYLEAGQARKALDRLSREKSSAPEIQNAVGVCLLRLGEAARAVEHYRGMTLSSGVAMRSDVPLVVRLNFATALFVSGNVAGCIAMLDEIRDEKNPTVQRLRAAIVQWKKSLPVGKKIQWFLGGEVNHPTVLDVVPGEL